MNVRRPSQATVLAVPRLLDADLKTAIAARRDVSNDRPLLGGRSTVVQQRASPQAARSAPITRWSWGDLSWWRQRITCSWWVEIE
jgi:hypothetical protein